MIMIQSHDGQSRATPHWARAGGPQHGLQPMSSTPFRPKGAPHLLRGPAQGVPPGFALDDKETCHESQTSP